VLSASASRDSGWITFSIYTSSICQFDAFLAGAVLAYAGPKVQSDPRLAYRIWTVTGVVCVLYVVTCVLSNVQSGMTGLDALRNIISGTVYGQGREVFVFTAVTLVAVSLMLALWACLSVTESTARIGGYFPTTRIWKEPGIIGGLGLRIQAGAPGGRGVAL